MRLSYSNYFPSFHTSTAVMKPTPKIACFSQFSIVLFQQTKNFVWFPAFWSLVLCDQPSPLNNDYFLLGTNAWIITLPKGFMENKKRMFRTNTYACIANNHVFSAKDEKCVTMIIPTNRKIVNLWNFSCITAALQSKKNFNSTFGQNVNSIGGFPYICHLLGKAPHRSVYPAT